MNDLLIIIVLYNVKINQIEYLYDLEDFEVLIYDNSNTAQECTNYHYFHDSSNPGVSKAYNYGITLAKQLNKKKVLILDQDTKFDKAALDQYERLYAKYGNDYIYAPIIAGNDKIYSPYDELKCRNKFQTSESFAYNERYSLKNKAVINSGLMIPVSLAEKLGGFDENIKLDFSDSYFIEKYKWINEFIILVNIKMEHSLSGDEGINKQKELSRFRFYCSGANYFYKKTKNKPRLLRMLFFRTFKLIIKYKSLGPVKIAIKCFKDN